MKSRARPLVAFDAGPAARSTLTGTELYARELAVRLPALVPGADWAMYSRRPSPGLDVDLTVMPFPRLWSQVRLPLELRRRRPDLLFVPSHVVPFWCPARPLAVVHDLAYEHFPEAYPRPARAYLRATTRWAEERCPVLLTVSQATRADLERLHGVDPARVVVAHPGGGEGAPPEPAPPQEAEDRRRLAELGVDGRFVLHVGRLEARKNQVTALAAVEGIPGLLLVCAGDPVEPEVVRRLEGSPRCRVLGRVDDATRELLYRRAAALVFPSLYEGFGFPVLEAMRVGLPVITVRTSSLPEVAGEAALFVEEPRDAGAVRARLEQLLSDAEMQRRLASEGRRRARLFTWAACAERVADVVSSLLR
ncbi:MAG: glycosyltransferase family 4 protein [Candidatus Dormibacterales bacterium]